MEVAALGSLNASEAPPPAGNWSNIDSAAAAVRAWSGPALASQAVLLLLIFGLSALGNGAVLLLIARHRQLRTVPNAFVLSLALAELLGALLCLPPAFASLMAGRPPGAWLFGPRFCRASAALHAALGIAATLTVALLAFDRYCAIARQPRPKLSRRRAAQLLASAWLAAMVLAGPWSLLPGGGVDEEEEEEGEGARGASAAARCPYVLPWGGSWPASRRDGGAPAKAYSATLIVLGFLLPFALMCFCHFHICRAVRLSESRVRPLAPGALAAPPPPPPRLPPRFPGETRTATTVLLMIVSLICCWGPYCALGLAAAAGRLPFSPGLDAAACWMAWANGAINPLIYAARNPGVASLLRRRNRQGGYLTGAAPAAAASKVTAARASLQAKSRRAARYASSSHGHGVLAACSPASGGGGGELSMWACRNPAVLFCRDGKPPAGRAEPVAQRKAGAFDTSL